MHCIVSRNEFYFKFYTAECFYRNLYECKLHCCDVIVKDIFDLGHPEVWRISGEQGVMHVNTFKKIN
jgi:hypothetical protein